MQESQAGREPSSVLGGRHRRAPKVSDMLQIVEVLDSVEIKFSMAMLGRCLHRKDRRKH